MKKYKTWVL